MKGEKDDACVELGYLTLNGESIRYIPIDRVYNVPNALTSLLLAFHQNCRSQEETDAIAANAIGVCGVLGETIARINGDFPRMSHAFLGGKGQSVVPCFQASNLFRWGTDILACIAKDIGCIAHSQHRSSRG